MHLTAHFEDNPDSDGDGLFNDDEVIYGTDPYDEDSDDDGLTDYEEVITYQTDPLIDADKDSDGLSDGYEINTSSTDPNDTDSDDDGFQMDTKLTLLPRILMTPTPMMMD